MVLCSIPTYIVHSVKLLCGIYCNHFLSFSHIPPSGSPPNIHARKAARKQVIKSSNEGGVMKRENGCTENELTRKGARKLNGESYESQVGKELRS